MKYQLDYSMRINSRGIGKPNEDLICVDRTHHLFMVLDGITRVHSEYDGTNRSAACEVNRIFSEKLLSLAGLIDEAHSPEELVEILRSMALKANADLIPFRQRKSLDQWQYYPGTVGIIASLWEDQLCCVWAGDCIGLHIRGESRRIVSTQQTLPAKRLGYGKAKLYSEVCNHPEHPCAYGIFNGDPQVGALLEQSVTKLCSGDVVLLSTDGLAAFLQFAPISEVRSLNPTELLDVSLPYDRPPFAQYADDKAVLRLAFV